ncbi:MAG: NFACT family protein [Candidatus Freyarchaeota archaeon]|nr:NFACT family protein [Candidatus Jordarchaeia archaeon]
MEAMSSLDIAAIVSELNRMLVGGRIRNVYQINRIFIFRVRTSNEDFQLLVEPGRRIHLTWYERVKPRFPPPFCMTLRKHLKHGRILSVQQYDFDRVVMLNVGFAKNRVTLVFELFGDGNIVLLDEEGKIIVAEKYASMKDRDILPKKSYLFPPSRGKDPRNISFEEFREVLAGSKGKIAAILVRNLSIGSILAEEACIRSGIEKERDVSLLSDDETRTLFETLKGLLEEVEGGINSGIVLRSEEAIIVSPVKLKTYSGGEFSWKEFESFNKAADEFYSKREELIVEEELRGEAREEEDKIQRMLETQRETLQKMIEAEEKYRRYGNLLYENIHLVSQLLEAVISARKKNYSWQEIEERIKSAKDKNLAARIFAGVKPHEGRILVELNEELIPLDVKLSATENANSFYEKAKKAAIKAERIKKAMEETLRKMEEVKEKKEEVQFKLRLKRKKKWYEAYRWMISSDGFLVLGGKDAKSNITLYKRMEVNDIFFHAEVHGAPVVIVKTEGKTCPESTLKEAAQFAVSYSRAWKERLLQVDAYWVHPDQVSETPPSGEYLPKGGLIIRGKRNYFRNVPLELAVGVVSEGNEIKVIAGAPSAVSKKTSIYVKIKPGELPSSKLAEAIRSILARKAPQELAEIILRIPLDEFQSVLPPGGGEITE